MKIAVIGGGSTYSPELVDGLITRERELGVREVALQDVDPERLEVLAGFAQRLTHHAGSSIRVTAHRERQGALTGADFVVTQLRVGGQEARHQDTLLGLRHGLIGQETTGVGGFGKALRTIPVMKELVRDLRAHCPEAWLINFTNPAGLITEALHRLGVRKLVGLCNIPIGMQMDIATALGVAAERVRLDYVGLNHLGWVRRVWLDDQEITGRVIEFIEDLAAHGAPANFDIEDFAYPPGFLKTLGFLASPYLRYFYLEQFMLAKLKKEAKTRAQEVMEIERELLRLYRDPAQVTKPEALAKRGGAYYSKIAVELIAAIHQDRRSVHIVNVPNQTAVTGIGPDQTVEIPCRVGRERIEPLPVGEVQEEIMGLIRQVKAYETLAARAGIEGSDRLAFLALVNHPLCRPEKARAVLDDIKKTFRLELT